MLFQAGAKFLRYTQKIVIIRNIKIEILIYKIIIFPEIVLEKNENFPKSEFFSNFAIIFQSYNNFNANFLKRCPKFQDLSRQLNFDPTPPPKRTPRILVDPFNWKILHNLSYLFFRNLKHLSYAWPYIARSSTYLCCLS